MAKKWSGFVAQNLTVKEEWKLLEACEERARQEQGSAGDDRRPLRELRQELVRGPVAIRVIKAK
jgi:hypothetical protein